MICTPIYTLSATIYSLYTPYLQPIFTYVHLIYNLYTAVYSYFEKGCRKKCMRHSRRALWVVLSALFVKCLLVLNESNKRGFHTYIHLIYNLYSPYMQPIFTYMHLICNLYTLYSQPIFTIYTLFTTYIHLCKPYSQTIFTYIHLIHNLYTPYTNYI